MSSNVRRLVFDVQPRGLFLFAVFLAEGSFADLTWADGSRLPIMAVVFALFPALILQAKVRAWLVLPVSGTEIGRARWWIMVAQPLLGLAGLLAACALGMAAFGHLHQSVPEILRIYVLQATLALLMAGFAPCAEPIIRRMGVLLGTLLLLLPWVGLVALWVSWSHPSAAFLQKWAPGLAVADGAALALLFITAPRWPLPNWPSPLAWSQVTLLPHRRGAPVVENRVVHYAPGWPALLSHPSAAMPAAAVWLLSIAAGLALSLLHKPDLFFLPAIYGAAVTALVVMQLAKLMRMLRGFPLGSIGLVNRLYGMAVGGHLLMIFVFVALGVGVFGVAHWGFVLAVCIMPFCLTCVMLPCTLRLGPVWSPAMMGCLAALLMFFSVAAARDISAARSPWLALGVVPIFLVLGWLWTWWEITRGRAAYRYRPVMAARWRGGF